MTPERMDEHVQSASVLTTEAGRWHTHDHAHQHPAVPGAPTHNHRHDHLRASSGGDWDHHPIEQARSARLEIEAAT